MELYTMNSRYGILSEIDYFSSSIWTERWLGDGDFQLVVPATSKTIHDLSFGTRIGMADSPEVMIVDKQTIKNGSMTVEGKSLTQNLNCRFFRWSSNMADKSFPFVNDATRKSSEGLPPDPLSPGWLLQFLVYVMAINLDQYFPSTGIGLFDTNLEYLVIPDLTIGSYDDTLAPISWIEVPYGPLFDVIQGIAKTYSISQRVERIGVGDIRYKNWRPVDRTSDSKNLVVRFSPYEDNFGDTTEVIDGSNYKTHEYLYADGLGALGANTPAQTVARPGRYTGFDLRADMLFASDITTSTNVDLGQALNQRAQRALVENSIVSAIDGTILPGSQYVYGTHYRLGDIVETQGTSGIIQKSRVTEYIRAQDTSGERAYPTLQAA